MANLDSMLERILADGAAHAAAVAEEADADIARQDEAFQGETDAQLREIAAGYEREAAKILALAQSGAATLRKKHLLETRSHALTDSVSQAERAMKALPDEQYFQLVLTLIDRYAGTEPGTVYLADCRALPDRAAFAGQIAALPGHKLTLAEGTVPLDSGALVSYGKIEENLSFGAVLAEKEEAIRDRLNELFFADAVKD